MHINQRIKVWNNKKILRESYKDWYLLIEKNMSNSYGLNLELGSSTGNIKEYIPNITTSDIEKTANVDVVVDAHSLPYPSDSLANIIMLDVLHHLYDPISFFKEAHRALAKNGCILLIEPYPSIFSLPFYKIFHNEPFIFSVDYFSNKLPYSKNKNLWDSNQAIPYLLFFKHKDRFIQNFRSDFKVIKTAKILSFLYIFSGGYTKPQLIPDLLIPVFKILDRCLSFLAPFMGFRCFIVLEKI